MPLLPVENTAGLKTQSEVEALPTEIKKAEVADVINSLLESLAQDFTLLGQLRKAITTATNSLKRDSDMAQKLKDKASQEAYKQKAQTAAAGKKDAAALIKLKVEKKALKLFAMDLTKATAVPKGDSKEDIGKIMEANKDCATPFILTKLVTLRGSADAI